MLKEIIAHINDQRTLNSHYIKDISKDVGIGYNTLYSLVVGRRVGSAQSAEKLIIWWLKKKGYKL